MGTFRSRIPPTEELIAVFVVCAIPIHFWSVFNVFREVPAWIIRMSLWEMLGIIAYTQVFALLETIILTTLITVAAIFLPGKLLRDDLVASSAIIMLVLTIWLIVLHYNPQWINERIMMAMVVWGISGAVAVLGGLWLVNRAEPLHSSTLAAVGRLSVLAILFVLFDLISFLIVLSRNLTI